MFIPCSLWQALAALKCFQEGVLWRHGNLTMFHSGPSLCSCAPNRASTKRTCGCPVLKVLQMQRWFASAPARMARLAITDAHHRLAPSRPTQSIQAWRVFESSRSNSYGWCVGVLKARVLKRGQIVLKLASCALQPVDNYLWAAQYVEITSIRSGPSYMPFLSTNAGMFARNNGTCPRRSTVTIRKSPLRPVRSSDNTRACEGTHSCDVYNVGTRWDARKWPRRLWVFLPFLIERVAATWEGLGVGSSDSCRPAIIALNTPCIACQHTGPRTWSPCARCWPSWSRAVCMSRTSRYVRCSQARWQNGGAVCGIVARTRSYVRTFKSDVTIVFAELDAQWLHVTSIWCTWMSHCSIGRHHLTALL